jgi:hypothetical protein
MAADSRRREQGREMREMGLECGSQCHMAATSLKPPTKTAEGQK